MPHDSETPLDPRPDPQAETGSRGEIVRRVLMRSLAVGALLCFVLFWTWALFFASKESINRIGDDAWRTRSQGFCATAATERSALADYTLIRGGDAEVMRQRADLVDQATDTLDVMLDEIEANPPTDEKGQHIVPMWTAEYRTYLSDRRAYAEKMRSTGTNVAFYETKVNAIPISERLATFAADNQIPDCVPPNDVSS